MKFLCGCENGIGNSASITRFEHLYPRQCFNCRPISPNRHRVGMSQNSSNPPPPGYGSGGRSGAGAGAMGVGGNGGQSRPMMNPMQQNQQMAMQQQMQQQQFGQQMRQQPQQQQQHRMMGESVKESAIDRGSGYLTRRRNKRPRSRIPYILSPC